MRLIREGLVAAAAALLAVCGSPALAQNSSSNLSAADKAFVQAAAYGGIGEERLGELAEKKGRNDNVQQFGQLMVTDHLKLNLELLDIASKKGIALPDAPNATTSDMISKLQNLHGSAFDGAYLRQMRKDHWQTIQAFQKEADSGADPDLRAFASRALPLLWVHYRNALVLTRDRNDMKWRKIEGVNMSMY